MRFRPQTAGDQSSPDAGHSQSRRNITASFCRQVFSAAVLRKQGKMLAATKASRTALLRFHFWRFPSSAVSCIARTDHGQVWDRRRRQGFRRCGWVPIFAQTDLSMGSSQDGRNSFQGRGRIAGLGHIRQTLGMCRHRAGTRPTRRYRSLAADMPEIRGMPLVYYSCPTEVLLCDGFLAFALVSVRIPVRSAERRHLKPIAPFTTSKSIWLALRVANFLADQKSKLGLIFVIGFVSGAMSCVRICACEAPLFFAYVPSLGPFCSGRASATAENRARRIRLNQDFKGG